MDAEDLAPSVPPYIAPCEVNLWLSLDASSSRRLQYGAQSLSVAMGGSRKSRWCEISSVRLRRGKGMKSLRARSRMISSSHVKSAG